MIKDLLKPDFEKKILLYNQNIGILWYLVAMPVAVCFIVFLAIEIVFFSSLMFIHLNIPAMRTEGKINLFIDGHKLNFTCNCLKFYLKTA